MPATLRRISESIREPRVDQQLRHNDCGVSAVKTVCDLLGVPINRSFIEASVDLDSEGSRLDGLKAFFDTHGFEAHGHVLDPNAAEHLEQELQALAPCIAVVRAGDSERLHYVVVHKARMGRIHVLDPATGTAERWTTAQFIRRVHHSKASFTDADFEDRVRLAVVGELAKYGITLGHEPTRRESAELFNKLAYFTFVKEKFGLREELAFLQDLVFEQEVSSLPSRFRTLADTDAGVDLRAPVVLAVRPPRAPVPANATEPEPSPIKQLLREVAHLRSLWYVFLFAAVISSVTTYVAVFVNQILVDDVLPQYDVGVLMTFIFGLALFRVFDLTTYVYTKLVGIQLGIALDRFFLLRFGDTLLGSRLSYLHTYTRGDLIERVGDSLRIKAFFTRFVSRILVNSIIALNALIILFVLDARIASIVLVVVVLLLAIFLVFTPMLRRVENERFTRKAALFSKLVDVIDGLQPIRVFGLEGYFGREVGAQAAHYNVVQRRGKMLDLASTTAVNLISLVFGLVILMLCSRRMMVDHTLTLGQLLTFTALSVKIFGSLSTLLDENLSLQENLVILKRYFDFGQAEAGPGPGADKDDVRVDVLEARGLTFHYPLGAPVLDGVSLSLRHGDKAALVGRNGSGKSTLVRILADLQEPTGGSVLVNGVHRELLDRVRLRRRVVLVSADDALFNDSLRFNITLGKSPSTLSVVEYAQRIGLYEYIVGHPDHLDRVIEEGGRNLSTGQKRMVLVLRALLCEADVLLFDEIFRGIDSTSKAAIITLLNQITDRAMLFISHEPLGDLLLTHTLTLRNGRVETGAVAALEPAVHTRELPWTTTA